jgi:hypothetical protein
MDSLRALRGKRRKTAVTGKVRGDATHPVMAAVPRKVKRFK